MLIVACCLTMNPALAAQNPPADPGAFAARLLADGNPAASRDRGAPGYLAEWWRLDASLVDRDGRPWQLEWTLYRQAPGPRAIAAGEQGGRMVLAHAAITTPDGDYHEQRFSAGGPARAAAIPVEGARGWEWVSRGETLFPARLSFNIGDRDLNLLLESAGTLVADNTAAGDPGPSSLRHYPSQPRIRVRGFVDRGADKTYLRGQGRFDREWNSPALADNGSGADWLSMRRDSHLSPGAADSRSD